MLTDLAAVALAALILYGATLMPGVGWGDGARLQTETALFRTELVRLVTVRPHIAPVEEIAARPVAPVFTAPAHLFVSLVPFGTPAWRFNLLMTVLSIATLLVLYVTLRQIVARPLAATMAVTALAFSHAFFLHAVRPSMMPAAALLFALFLLATVRHLLLEHASSLVAIGILLLLLALILPQSLLMTAPTALYVALRRFWKTPALFWLLFLPQLAGVVVSSDFGLFAPVLLSFFVIFQFPIVGWLFLILGCRLLAHRARPILEIAILAAAGAAPLAHGLAPADLMGAMLLSSLPLALLVGAGLEHLLERVASRPEPLPILTPLLFASLALFPLLTAVAGATFVRATGLDTRLAIETPSPVRIRDNPWNDAVWYALWPPKNGLGGEAFIEEAEAVLPERCVLLVDPEVGAALEYARRVEGRLAGVRPLAGDPDDQMAEVSRLAAEGWRIFLAGIDPAFYDLDGLGRMGDLIERGRFYEWIPAT